MIGYFAGSTSKGIDRQMLEMGALHRLRSYIEFNGPDDPSIYRFPHMFLDSGAFSASTQGIRIDIDAYAEFVKAYKATVSSNLDVIGDFESSAKNFKHLLSKGCDVIPVVHFGATEKQLRYYFSEFKYVAIGGLVPYARQKNALKGFLDFVFSIAKDYWPLKLHAFGIWSKWVLCSYPFYSADATSWLAFSRYGNTKRPLHEKMIHYINRTQPGQNKLLGEIPIYLQEFRHYTNLWKARGIVYE